MYRYVVLCAVMGSLLSCKTIAVDREMQNTTNQNLMLGVVGEYKGYVLEKDYNHIGFPKYQAPIKIQASQVSFNKTSYKAFLMAKANQSDISFNETHNDSSFAAQKFLKLEISDRISVLNALNAKANAAIFEFLRHKKEAHIISSISIAFNANDMQTITDAEELFIEPYGLKSYALNVYNKGVLAKTVPFNNGVIFAYQGSNTCWKENDKYQLEIVDLVEGNDDCAKGTYASAKRAKKKINYYKF